MKTILRWIVKLMINNDLFHNRGKFKKGDVVKYNWKAKAYLGKTVVEENDAKRIKKNLYPDSSGVEFTDGDCCDPFWIRRMT